MEIGLFADDFDIKSKGSVIPSVIGMDAVVATVSGYHGTERFTLIKLIAQTGASYVGTMGKSTTHLVCWRCEGKKYNLAKDYGTVVISHRWFEDCLKEWKRLPEGPYTMQSGQEAGPISWKWEPTDALDTSVNKATPLARERNILSDHTNASNHSESQEIDARSSDLGYFNWPISHLLNENSFPSWDTKMKGSKNIQKLKKSSKQHGNRSNQDNMRQPLCSFSPQPEGSRSFLRHKRSLHDSAGKDVIGESVHKNCHLVKKKTSVNLPNHVMLDCNHGDCITGSRSQSRGSINSESACLKNSSGGIASSSKKVTSKNMAFNCDGSRVHELEEVEETNELSRNSSMRDNAVPIHGAASQNNCSEHIMEKANPCGSGVNQNEQIEVGDGIHDLVGGECASTELSCVICWTDFCSTRGVLRCGHRFCYSCIQGWADCMAAKGKVSSCPLCKTSFMSITRFEAATSPDQKIYSQTIPSSSSKMEFLMLLQSEDDNLGIQTGNSVCYQCGNREPEDLMVRCHLCQRLSVHTCCLDPPLVPWTCIHCRDLRTLYQRFR